MPFGKTNDMRPPRSWLTRVLVAVWAWLARR